MNQFTTEESNAAKALVQGEANQALDANGGSGLVVMATGSGKSKVGVDRAVKVIKEHQYALSNSKILVVVPTEILRDVNWKVEFNRWAWEQAWSYITPICYRSLHSIEKTHWDLIILDECHNITLDNSQFFFSNGNTWGKIIGLTATEPRDKQKKEILEKIGLKLVYELSLDRAVELGVVAPYDIAMIGVPLDGITKYIKAGNKTKHWITTEVKQNEYYNEINANFSNKRNALNRLKFIKSLRSKIDASKKIIEHLVPEDSRMLIFCPTKEQADEMCEYRYYSKPTKPKKLRYDYPMLSEILEEYDRKVAEYQGKRSLELFIDFLINRCSCCEALNEGINLSNLDIGFMVYINSSDLNLVQRIGRHIRFREGHRGKIIIMYAMGTIEEQWVRTASRKLDQGNIRWIEYEKLRKGEDYINF